MHAYRLRGSHFLQTGLVRQFLFMRSRSFLEFNVSVLTLFRLQPARGSQLLVSWNSMWVFPQSRALLT